MAKYPDHIHSILPGTAGTPSNTFALRLGSFNFGTNWREYGATAVSNYWALIEPSYNGPNPTDPASLGQTGGLVVYEYKAANGPSIHTFAPGATASFVEYTAVIGATPGMTTVQQAINYYNGNATAVVVSNTFKSCPDVRPKFVLDADQLACVRPNNTNFGLLNTTNSRELSPNKIVYSNLGTFPIPGYNGIKANPNPLPWYLDFEGASETSLSATSGAFLSGVATFSISMWVYFIDIGGYDFDLLTILSGTGGGYAAIDMYMSGGNLTVDYAGALGNVQQLWISATNNQWYNITVSVDAGNDLVTLYVDGSVVAQDSISTGWTGWSAPFTNMSIGGSAPGQKPSFYLNSLYIWEGNMENEVPGTGGLNCAEFFYQSSVLEFV